MKKIKIMLIAITVIAAAGGALAFKANKICCSVYTTNNPVAGATCPFPLYDATITSVNPGTVKISVTDKQNTSCILTWTKLAL